VKSSCECDNETLGSINAENFSSDYTTGGLSSSV
jgi:hypothetical protein